MTRLIFGAMVGFLLSSAISWASVISSPRIVADKETLLYLRKIHNNLHNFPVTTTDPNGSRRGKNGDTVLFNDSGTYRLRFNTNTEPEGGTTWVANS